VKYEKTKSLPGISTALVEGFDDGGFLKIDPKKNKPKQTAMQHRMLFTVISGRARVRVLDKSDTLEKESMFVVPKGGEYSIKNLDSQEPLVLSFARLSRS
jgi:mannose-6-phosphate isomerase-like protein (cupin superfamily)